MAIVSDEDVLAEPYERYACAVGKVAHQWNHMQEALGKLFCAVAGLDEETGLGVWYSTNNDRAQREMLSAALKSAQKQDRWSKLPPMAAKDIEYVLKEANSLADMRNDAIHAPCSIAIDAREITMIPAYFYGTPNPRALKLKGKNLFDHFAWYAETAKTIRFYAQQLQTALQYGPRYTWPERPPMPSLIHSKSRKESHPRKHAK